MTLKDLATLFNRSVFHAFEIRRFLFVLITLIISGIIYLFFQGIAFYSAPWLQMPLKTIPLFIMIGFIMAAGTFVIHSYSQEVEGSKGSFLSLLKPSWELILKATYLALPLLILFLFFWILFGVFVLLKTIPYLGKVLGVILAFGPFLLSLGVLLLFLAALFAFFFAAPPLAVNGQVNRSHLMSRFKSDPFSHLILLGVASVPLLIAWKFLNTSANITFQLYSFNEEPIETVFQSVFILLPFAGIFTPFLIFFFLFAYDSYKELEKSS